LSKGHTEKLVPARKAFDFVVAIVTVNAFVKFVNGQKVHELGEDGFPRIHESSPSATMQKYDSFERLYRKKTFYRQISLYLGSYRTFST